MHRDFSQLKNKKFDLLVCGGGIYGAWTAYDAALRGLRVAIVDKGDWAGATSSASSKLIHGGLRYLETFNFKLVKKSLAERHMLLQAAPHRVWPLRFGVPVYQQSRIGSFRLKIGLALYDFLAGNIPAEQQYHHHSTADFISHFPFLNALGLTGGFTYFDAQTDDARFVLELIEGAYTAGAVCVNYCEAQEFVEKNGLISSVILHDVISNETLSVETRQVVDTMGRWSPLFNNGKDLPRLSKGIHLVMPTILQDEALLLTAKSDGRVFFIIPWYGLTLLGTTDTNYTGDTDNIPITKEDINYLLREANRVFKNVSWTEKDIIAKFAGLRVLQHSGSHAPSSISRDWDLKTLPNGLHCSIGGKFTSAREDAAAIVDTVCQHLGINVVCQTFGKPFPWLHNTDYPSLLAKSLTRAQQLGIDETSALWLTKRHGSRVYDILKLCADNPDLTERINPTLPIIMADLVFCAEHEMVVHLDDLLRRRIPLVILAQIMPDEAANIARIAAKILGWSANQTELEISNCLHYCS